MYNASRYLRATDTYCILYVIYSHTLNTHTQRTRVHTRCCAFVYDTMMTQIRYNMFILLWLSVLLLAFFVGVVVVVAIVVYNVVVAVIGCAWLLAVLVY